MNEQTCILILLALSLFFTLGMYIWRAVRQVKNKNDERWNTILLKANRIAEAANWILVFAAGIICIKSDLSGQMITISAIRISMYIMMYFGFRNLLEWIGLLYYERTI